MTEFDIPCVNNMFNPIFIKPLHTAWRILVRGSIPQMLDYDKLVSENLAFFYRMAAQALETGGCFVVIIIQIDASWKYNEPFSKTEFYVMLFPYTIVHDEEYIVGLMLQGFLQRCVDFATVCKKRGNYPQRFIHILTLNLIWYHL